MDEDSDDQSIVTITLLVANSISLFGSMFIILAYLTLKLNMFSFRLVVYIAIADMIHSIGLMLPLSQPWCHIQALSLEYSSVSSIAWTSIMAYSLHDAVINLNPTVESKEKIFIFIGFALPALISSLPETTSAYGYAGGWCWIVNKNEAFLWRVFCFYIYLVFVIVYIIVVYVKVYRKVYTEVLFTLQDREARKHNNDLILRLKMYPLVLIVCYSAVGAKRIIEGVWQGYSNFWLSLVAGLLMSLLGFFDALVYGMSREVRDEIRRACRPIRKTSSGSGISFGSYDQLNLNN